MPSCEKCWNDAAGNSDKYLQLIAERKETPCTPEEQAGEDALICHVCNRKAVHQYALVCMACGHPAP